MLRRIKEILNRCNCHNEIIDYLIEPINDQMTEWKIFSIGK